MSVQQVGTKNTSTKMTEPLTLGTYLIGGTFQMKKGKEFFLKGRNKD